jgi:hypothetical protein
MALCSCHENSESLTKDQNLCRKKPIAPHHDVRPIASRTPTRLLVLTDIEVEPDDTQSLVRLLLYFKDIDLVGLVATTSIYMQSEIHPDSIRAVINACDRVRANLLKHAPGYPAASDLQKLVVEGQPAYGMAAVGKG